MAEYVMRGIIAACLMFVIYSSLYFRLGWFKRFFHDVMGWHTPDKHKEMTCDGFNIHAICKHCGERIMRDSQGNWFTYDGGADDE